VFRKRKRGTEAERLGVDFRKVVEKALEEEVRHAKMARFRELVENALKNNELGEEDWVRSVREVREES